MPLTSSPLWPRPRLPSRKAMDGTHIGGRVIGCSFAKPGGYSAGGGGQSTDRDLQRDTDRVFNLQGDGGGEEERSKGGKDKERVGRNEEEK